MKYLVWLFCALAILQHGFGQSGVTQTVLVCAHRGEHFEHPENSLPAIQAAIDIGADYVELDIQTTQDGHLVLMHDRTVDRMTDGKGPVANMTLAEIRQLDLGARFPGKFSGLRVPTFDEALEVAKGRISIYVDTKNAAPKDLVEAIDRHDMGKRVVFWSEHADFLKQVSDLRPGWALMPEASNPETVRSVVALLHPKFLGFGPRDFNAPTIAASQAANTGIFVDLHTEPEWRKAVEIGVAGIQTDHPAQLLAFLRATGRHR